MADRFSRFNEDRDFQGNHFDQYEEGQLELEQASLDKPIESDNVGHRLLQKHGWKLGQGLGKTMQGRTDPVPIILKYDVMGMGRMEMELDYAEDVTERRRALEVEKEDTEELRQKYKDYAEKEKAIAKALEDLRANFYCELCDKQYQKHQEFDNHINSYDHAHKQRLKELKQREFARNVSSKSRRDEKKQEKALRRLHELAEQRKQRDCAPGSGPMFKATTVAVDEESSEDGSLYPDGTPVLAGASEGMPAEEKRTPSYGEIVSVASPKQGANTTVSVPPVKNSSTPQPKVGFSFSFAKKVPVKLETTASVFKELGEEVLTDESQKEEEEKTGCDPLVPPKLPGRDSPLSTQAKAASGGEGEQQDSEGGALASTLSKLKMMMKREEESFHQEPQYYHYIPPAHCRVKPNFQFLLFMRASDQSSCREESEKNSQCPQDAREGDSSKQGEDRPGDSKLKETWQGDNKRTDCKHKEEHNSQQRAAAAEPRSTMVKVKEKVGSPKVTTSEKQPVEYKKTIAEPNDGPRRPNGPFFPVLSKDESTTLQWPSELLEFTRAQPSLSYSCNPLYFDFKLSRNKNGRGKLTTEKSGPVCTGEQQAVSQKARLEAEKPTGNIGEGTGNKQEQTAAASGDGQTEPALTSPAPKKDKTLKSHKQKKKKKKHKKSSKRSKQKERGSGVGKSEEAPNEKCKKRKKHKQKKSKNRASEERESQGLQAVEVSEEGKRKRLLQDNHQRTATEESSRGSQAKSSEPTSSSEEHNGAKRHKSEPATVAYSSSSLRKRSSSRGRRSQSRHRSSEEDKSEDCESSRRKSSFSRTQRQHRHYSEDSERSLSGSSRRGGRCHSQQASSRSCSDSSSSGRFSERSSRYSVRRGCSSSDSYSDYSECSRHSKHSPTSDSDYGCSRRSCHRSHRRQHPSSESSCSRSNSRGRGSHRRRSQHRSSCSSSSRSNSWKRSQSSYSRSSGSRSRRSSSSTKGSARGGNRHHESSFERRRRRDFNRSKIYRSQSPHCSSRTTARREETRTSSSTTSLQRTAAARGGAASTDPEPSIVVERNSLTTKQLLEKVQARKGPEDGPTASGNAGIKLMDAPQGYFGPKLPPLLGNKAVFPLFGKLPVVKKPLMRRPDELASEWAEEMEIPEADGTTGEVVFVEPIREFPLLPSSALRPQLGENGQARQEGMPAEASACLFEPEPGLLFQPYPSEPCQDPAKVLTLEPFLPKATTFPGYTPQPLEEEEPEAEEDSSLAPLESQPITFTPEEMEKYSKLQLAAQQHIQQQLLAKQVKSFPVAANLAPAPALQPIHIQQPAAATATATSITTVQHAILQHHAAAAAAIGLHPHPHHHHPQQLAQVHHIPQHHLTPFSLSPLGHSLIPAHHTAFLSSHPIHIIPASAIHHTQLALHHVPHTALYPTLFAPRPAAAAAAAAALHLHPLLHPIFSGQDLQHPPNHGS
ncbi:G patch domain-containing protein 8-like isoform X1 [Acipenser oxyrinchus oxyrinchus]|uniref:G patch domain-containing protein 8-like isoform X1 n=1 Tax=Acipenser oxyrinchus oxyrinchus TaxID=40147 RepID=A0AAD8CVZ8_ACIOX|nr:G patch domain-containing protein 8-like isoform X1 [Acipenser oxyrinchus oxyrinchus]